MNPYIKFDSVKTPAVFDRIAEKYEVSSEEFQAIMAGKQALALLGPTPAKDYAERLHKAYCSFKEHLESLDRPATQSELDNLALLAPYEDPAILHHEVAEDDSDSGFQA